MRKKTLQRTLKILTLLMIILMIITMLGVKAKGEEFSLEQYKTKYEDINQIYVEERQKFNCLFIYDEFDEYYKLLFSAQITLEPVTATDNVNIRKFPNIESESLGLLKPDNYMVEVGRSFIGWSIVIIDGEWAFIWSEHLEYVEITEVDNLITSAEDLNSLEYLGNCRISSYCYRCNTPSYSYKSSRDGWPCEEWKTCAANGIPIGTHLYVEGYGEFVVNDRGPSAMNGGRWIDLFVATEDCHIWCKRDVWILN